MPILSPDSLSVVDILLLLVILVGMPLEALLTRRKTRQRLASDEPGIRAKLYRETMILLWGVTAPILLIWAISDRSWNALGLGIGTGWASWLGWALAALPALFFIAQFAAISSSSSARQQLEEALHRDAALANFMPHTKSEYRTFRWTSITAGFTEEIIFRGYLIWALALFTPLWVAALISLFVFTLLHAYQGLRQLPFVALTGAWFTMIVIVSSSLWPAIALHMFIDLINNDTVWTARKRREAAV